MWLDDGGGVAFMVPKGLEMVDCKLQDGIWKQGRSPSSPSKLISLENYCLCFTLAFMLTLIDWLMLLNYIQKNFKQKR